MTLASLAQAHPAIVSVVSPYGVAHLRADKLRAMVVEIEADEREPLHYSFEAHGVSPAQLAAILAALDPWAADGEGPRV